MITDPLLEIASAALDLLLGETRQRLIRYLLRWEAYAVLRSYLERWQAAQPLAVGLRENRAQLLLAEGAAREALAIVDQIDGERGSSSTRRELRVRCLIALERYPDAHALLDEYMQQPAQQLFVHLQRGDLYRTQGAFDAAAHVYQAAAHLDPASAAPPRRMAMLALAQGDAEGARGQIDALMLRPEFSPTIDDLLILRDAARLAEDAESEAALVTQLLERRRLEAEPIAAELGVRVLRHVPEQGQEPEIVEPAQEHVLPAEAYALLQAGFGLSAFRPNQSRVIASVLAGRSTLAVMPTGAGKSLTYQLPALLLPDATVIVSPLIALMKDQLEGLPDEIRQRATTINSSLNGVEVATRLRAIAAGEYKLVYIAPERLRNRAFLHALKRCGISLFVIDEAHCISLWGQSFRPDYLFIGRALVELGNPPLLALTATASRETQAEIQATLGAVDLVSASVFRPNLHFQVVRAGNQEEKQQSLIGLCHALQGSIIVYARARQTCEELAQALRQAGIRADHYHAQVADRSACQERFMCGETRVLVATVAFGMGIDKADIRGIIHYNMPQSVEAYYQEAGRAGRDGQPASCIMLYAAADKSRMTQWLHEQAITREMLRELYRGLRQAVQERVSQQQQPTSQESGKYAGSRYAIVNLDVLQRSLQVGDETFTRVGLRMLEQVGLLRRHYDLPRSASVTLRAQGLSDQYCERMAAYANLEVDQPCEVDLLAWAEQADLEPAALEAQLLEWQDAGYIRYQGSNRDALLEFTSAPANVGEQIDQLLAEYQQRQAQRVEAMAAYARSAQCRHRTIAAHFGQRLAACRKVCDICVPAAAMLPDRPLVKPRPSIQPLAQRNHADIRSDEQRVLDGLAHLPIAMGRSGLAKVLKGSPSSPVDISRCPEFGSLNHLPLTRIEQLIERLVATGQIQRDERHEYRLLSLSALGRSEEEH